MPHSVLVTTLLIISTVLIVNILFRAVRLPVILGYLIAGSIVGPHILKVITDIHAIQSLAEFGVVLLMFTIGLEFSLSKLITLRYPVFVLGGLQVIVTIFVTVLIGRLISLTLREAIVIGCVVAMSSTALVMKQLSEQLEIHSRHGLNAVGILLFQDLAVVPILIIIASLGSVPNHFYQTFSVALVKGILSFLLILGLGRWILKPLFHLIARMQAGELFTLAVLFVALGSAWITEMLGMTYALGAFLSGIMLGETEFRHQIKEEIRPFRDVLLGLFFVSIGMLVDIRLWWDTWIWIFLTLLAVIIGKFILIWLLCFISRYGPGTSLRTALILAEGGEFGFAILTLALETQLLPLDYGQVVLAALLISFALAPILIRYNERLANYLFPQDATEKEARAGN